MKYNQKNKRCARWIAAAAITTFMAAAAAFPAFADTVYVNASSLNFRATPSTDGLILGTLPRGEKIERISNDGEWSEIKVGKTSCFVATRYLSDKPPADSASTSAQSGALGVQTPAKSPYVSTTWNVGLDPDYKYASFSKINSGKAVYYKNNKADKKGKTVCINAGHGTKGGSSVKTQCHPDGTPKVTGGTTNAGATSAAAVSSGMTFNDGTAESTVTLSMAKILRDRLLAEGYDVLMIREESDVQLDNVARTVIANNNADCHIALHWDSTTNNKGCFYMSVPDNKSYRAMEPVASHWQSHNRLGENLITGLKNAGNKIFSSGAMEMDLTQTSFSTIPSIDIELGDKASSHSEDTLNKLADGLVAGINGFFGF